MNTLYTSSSVALDTSATTLNIPGDVAWVAIEDAANIGGRVIVDDLIDAVPVAPEMALSQGATGIADGGTHDFGARALNSSTDTVFTVANSGSGNLTLSTPISLGGANADQFSIQAQPSSTIASGGGETTYTLRFTPTSTGTKTATIAIANNDSDENPYNLTITGTGTAPEMALSQGAIPIADGGSYGFGNHALNSSSNAVFTVVNSGNSDLMLTTPISLGGANADQFSIQTQPSSPVAAGGGTTTYTVRFTPTSAGAKTATIAIANNDSDENPYNLSVTGVGTAPPAFSMSFAPNSINADSTSTLTLTIDNSSNTVGATNLSFTDNLPAGLVVSTPSNAATTCSGGTLTALSGTGNVSFTGGTAAANTVCVISVDTTSSNAGTYINTSGDLLSSLGTSGSATDTLTVISVPEAPVIGTATAGEARATIEFTAPASDGGSPITEYTATSTPENRTGTCSSSPCTVTGLTNDTTYTFTVKATNSVGTSEVSEASNSVTPSGDTDGDGTLDSDDAFPFDPVEKDDFDGDGIGDNGDAGGLGVGVRVVDAPLTCQFQGPVTAEPVSTEKAPGQAISTQLRFVLAGCGSSVSIEALFGDDLPNGSIAYKVTSSGDWIAIPNATIEGNKISYIVTDGGPLDEDSIPGTITDPVTAVVLPASVTAVPTLPEWTRIFLAAVIGLIGVSYVRRRWAW
ncbi:choice-of-anchor D domain-containing protein [Parahaliea mediterranea]|uniref:Choice-of-anchor D domain-containing protein n=1 Tax=Parahaliea mediterranea TaxID=651086 RepID=A0A939IJU6_9GAMM|nr:choice-of-anchor D domain-containing protein [Parahaliea mediterranea]MBN7798059.1 choice-of-anchor D domain-containing protein [Parahaliea mediterranea]